MFVKLPNDALSMISLISIMVVPAKETVVFTVPRLENAHRDRTVKRSIQAPCLENLLTGPSILLKSICT